MQPNRKDPSMSAYGKRVQDLLDLNKKSVVTDTQILKLVKINEIQLTARQCIDHLKVHEGNDANKVGIFLPDVNHHKLQLNEEKYKQMRNVLKSRLEQRFFQRKLHVTALSVNKDKKGVPFTYQGKLTRFEIMKKTRQEIEEDQMWGEFITNEEDIDKFDGVYCPLDGLHREFALLDIIATEGKQKCRLMLDTPFSLSVYYPHTDKPLNNEDSERFAELMRILSKIIAENANLSLNSTLCDAVSSVACIEGFRYTSDFLLATKDVQGANEQFVRLKYKYQKEECIKNNPMPQTMEIFKALVKSEDYLTLFKSKWKAKYPKNSDFKEQFWMAGEGTFSDNPNLKLFFIKSYEIGGHCFLKNIKNDSPNYAVESKKEMGVEYACYSVARAIEPLFFSEFLRNDLSSDIDTLTTSGLITMHRLSFMSTLAYEVSNMIVDEFYRYSDFLSGNKDENDHVLKSADQKLSTKPRKGIAQRILFNFILTKIWNAYSQWVKVYRLEDKELRSLEKRLRNLENSIIQQKTSEQKKPYNLGLDMVDLLHPSDQKFNKREKSDHLRIQVMDLYALRYADYLRIMLCSFPKRYRITLPLYQFCIAQGKTLSEREIDFSHARFAIHFFDLIQNAEGIWDVFRTCPENIFNFTQEEKKDIMRARALKFVTYIEERFGIYIDDWEKDLLVANSEWEECDDTINEDTYMYFHIDLHAADFLQDLRREPNPDIKGLYNPLDMKPFFMIDHYSDRLKTNPTDTMKQYKIPLVERGITNKKWAEYLDEIMEIYGPNEENEESSEETAMYEPWDTLHNKIMGRYRRSRDKDTFASGIVNFAISRLVKKSLRMKMVRNDEWKPPKDHITSGTIEVPKNEAESMLQHLKITTDVPPFIGHNFFCGQKKIAKSNTFQYQKGSPARLKSELSSDFEADKNDFIEESSEEDEDGEMVLGSDTEEKDEVEVTTPTKKKRKKNTKNTHTPTKKQK